MIVLPLEIVPEPKLRWQRTVGIHVDKAIDDQGQQLMQATAQSVGARADAPAGAMFPAANWGGAQAFVIGSRNEVPSRITLKKGEKRTRLIKELSGKISATVLGRPDPVMVVSNIMKSIGKSVEVDGTKLEILDIGYPDEGKMSIRFALVTPQAAAPVGVLQPRLANGKGKGGFGAPAVMGDKIQVEPAALAAFERAQVELAQVLRAGGPVNAAGVNPQEFSLVDDKGEAFPRIGSSARSEMGPAGVTVQHEYIFDTSKNKSQPSAFTYSVRKPVTVEVPFMLKDVPVEGQ
jgi:hypothetical protein